MLNYSKCYIWTAVKSSCMDNCQSYPMLRWNCVHTSCGFLELFTFQIRFCFFIFLQSFYVLYCTNFILNKINKYINTYVSKENTNIGSVLCWHVVLMKTVSTKFFFLCHLYHVTWSFPYHMPRCLPLQFFNSLIHRQVQLQNSTKSPAVAVRVQNILTYSLFQTEVCFYCLFVLVSYFCTIILGGRAVQEHH